MLVHCYTCFHSLSFKTFIFNLCSSLAKDKNGSSSGVSDLLRLDLQMQCQLQSIINGKDNNESCNKQIIIVQDFTSEYPPFPWLFLHFFSIHDDANQALFYSRVSATSSDLGSDSCPVWFGFNCVSWISSELFSKSFFANINWRIPHFAHLEMLFPIPWTKRIFFFAKVGCRTGYRREIESKPPISKCASANKQTNK